MRSARFRARCRAISTTCVSLRLGEQAARDIAVALHQGVVDAQAVILDAPREDFEMLLLPSEAFKDLQQLGRWGVQGVIKLRLVGYCALLPAKSFFPQAGNFAVNIQILAFEMIQLRGKRKQAIQRAQPASLSA